MWHVDDLTYAYLAGVMDSDGWFTIKRHAANTKYAKSYTYSENAGCGQATPEAVELLQAAFGGVIHLRGRKGGEAHWRPLYYWSVFNRQAATLAETLKPYLRIKAAQADLITALRASKDRPRDHSRSVVTGILRGRALDPAIVAERHAYYERIRSMNDRRRSNRAFDAA
jgi:hypothetical protein